MQQATQGFGSAVARMARVWGLAALALVPLPVWSADDAADQGPPQEVFMPKAGKGPIVVVLSGQSGPPSYRRYAGQLADRGYYTVLLDGKDILTRQQDGAKNLRTAIAKAQTAANAVPGKVAVIGFSQGGGGVLAHAIAMPDLITMAVVHYPATSWSKNLDGMAARIQIPILILAAELDRYNNNCCGIESMRELEAAAKAKNKPLELVVYPNADHGFNLDGRQYRGDDTADAWRRATQMLDKYQPVK
jgi:dienelactone hydrolase